MTSHEHLTTVAQDDLTITEWGINTVVFDSPPPPEYTRARHDTVAFYVTRSIVMQDSRRYALLRRCGDPSWLDRPSWHILHVPVALGLADVETSVFQFLTREVRIHRAFAKDVAAVLFLELEGGAARDSVTRKEFRVRMHLHLRLEKLTPYNSPSTYHAHSEWFRAEAFGVAAAPGLEGTTCAICLEDLGSSDQLKGLPCCTHVFHSSCILHWVRTGSPTCPCCRRYGFYLPGSPSCTGEVVDTSH